MERDEDDDRGPGKLKNGFNRVARDLHQAWALAGLTKPEHVILHAALTGCWVLPLLRKRKGEPMPEPQPCHINVSELARKLGHDRTALQKALRSLVASNLLRRVGGDAGPVVIVKDYRTWVEPARPATARQKAAPERPRFTPLELDYIRASCSLGAVRTAPAIDPAPVAHSPQSDAETCGECATPPVVNSPHPLWRIHHTPCGEFTTPPVAHSPQVQPGAIEERGRELESSSEREERGLTPREHTHQSAGVCGVGVSGLSDQSPSGGGKAPTTGPTTAPIPETPAGPGMLGRLPVEGKDSPESLALQERLAGEAFPRVLEVVRSFCGALPIPWIEATYAAKVRGHEHKGESRLAGLLDFLLKRAQQSQACEWYAPPVASSPPGSPTPAPSRGGELPSVVRQREMRRALMTPKFEEMLASRGDTDG